MTATTVAETPSPAAAPAADAVERADTPIYDDLCRALGAPAGPDEASPGDTPAD